MSGEEKSALDKWRERKKVAVKAEILSKPQSEASVLSHGQERLWLLEQLYADQNLYTYAHKYTFKGSLDLDLLIQCFREIVDRHEILRSTYRQENEQVIQEVHTAFELSITYFDEKNDHKRELEEFIKTSFNLEKDLPIRLGLIKVDKEHTEVVLVLHHIAGDAWSMSVINQELSKMYKALLNNQEIADNRLPIQYIDYAFWQKNQATKQEDLDYWKLHLENESGSLNLPKQAKSTNSFKGKSFKTKLAHSLSEKIRQTAKDQKVTFFVFWLATFKLFLSKYTNQPTLTVGSPFSNRDKKETESLIGFFNETLVLKADLTKDVSFSDFVNKTNQVVLESISHKNVPFETLVNELKPDRSAGENPLFSAMFLYNNEPEGLSLPDLSIREEVLDVGVAKFDLTLFVNEAPEITLSLEHSESFDDEFISSMMDHYETFLSNVIDKPNAHISKIAILSNEEINVLTNTWNDTSSPIPEGQSINILIDKHVQKTPNSIAVRFSNQTLTYKELDEWANAIATKLTENGIQSNEFVGIYAHRSLEMVAAILGILKAGAAYLPLDPTYPELRLQSMIEDAKANYLLVHPDLKNVKLDASKIEIERSSLEQGVQKEINADDYAYIIYTSGSTGKPKGVAVTHQNLIYSTSARYTFFEDQMKCFLLLSSFSFDSSVAGIFWSLTTGGTLVLPPERIEQDLVSLSNIIAQNRVTHTLLLPSLYQVLLNFSNIDELQSLVAVMVAGEAASTNLQKDHFTKLPNTRLYNEYGPTEATVWCVAHEIKANEIEADVPIGKPIPNYTAYVLDRHKNPLPAGLEGLLYIGGKAVTKGYLNHTDLTNQKFCENPFDEGRIYQTGDLVKWRKNGVLDFLGREDAQIKIRGQRIEIGEIKQVFLQHKGVEDIEIQIIGEEKKSIAAYIKTNQKLEKNDLINNVKRTLPDHMVPSHIVLLAAFPTLPNGKVDFSKLLLPDSSSTVEYTAPSTETEKHLVDIWETALKIEKIGINDNFFEIGGDSIRSIQVIAKAQKIGIAIEATGIFKYQTIAALSQNIQEKLDGSQKDDWSSIVPMKTNGDAPPLFCLHSGGAHVMFYREFANEIGGEHPVYAIQPKGLDSDQSYHQSIAEMATKYIEEIKKVQPKGPYHLLGTCFSNAVGLDMLHQLKATHDEVAVFYVIDSAPAYLVPPSPNGERMPVRRMLKMIRKGNFDGIYKKLRNRFILTNRKINRSRTSEVQKDLYDMIGSLNTLYSGYTWRPIQENVVLIRSSEFANRKAKQFHLDHWSILSEDSLEIHEVDGHHKTLFQHPEVVGLANLISQHKSALDKKLTHAV